MLTAETPVEERLRRLAGAPAAQRRGSGRKRGLLRQLLLVVGEYGFGRGDSSLTHAMSVAGFRSANATMVYLGARTLVSFGPALMILVPQVSAGKPMGRTLWLA